MAEKHCTAKAARAVINIGNIAINVYPLADGSCCLAGRGMADAVDRTLTANLFAGGEA